MKKTRANAGFTLMEVLVTLVIMVLLAVGIGIGMNSGTVAYQKSIFDSNSAMLADTLNTSLGDLLRYSQDVRPDGTGGFVFTNREYGVRDGYFCDTDGGIVKIYDSYSKTEMALVNSGAYPDLKITDFSVEFVSTDGESGYFDISYKIESTADSSLVRNITTAIRLL